MPCFVLTRCWDRKAIRRAPDGAAFSAALQMPTRHPRLADAFADVPPSGRLLSCWRLRVRTLLMCLRMPTHLLVLQLPIGNRVGERECSRHDEVEVGAVGGDFETAGVTGSIAVDLDG